ncbi:uncharacterized protein LOC134195762 isoform X2 [Corticium candelabrum]|uniref:uncharacterized protein LOC134195762 isoform X2 n=1 Tax=Corticium candelabrum TaxID=121492 RepID=UPI002E275D41|nr:uncharacterized protein LOC134195762 isoform X2 [Corticium candelabrum]
MWNAHTIKVPPVAPYCGDIIRIKFKFCVRCAGGASWNDWIHIWNPRPGQDQQIWGSRLHFLDSIGKDWGVSLFYACHERTYTAGDPVFNYIAQYGELNVALQDDSTFDYTQLTLYYDTTPKSCYPTKTTEKSEAFQLFTGWKQVSLVDHLECGCQGSRLCRRHSMKQTFYKNSLYQKDIDVGRCLGPCSSYAGAARSCRALKTTSTTINGPNGAQCVEVIKSCACSAQCYKKSHYEQYVESNPSSQTERILNFDVAQSFYATGPPRKSMASHHVVVTARVLGVDAMLLRNG